MPSGDEVLLVEEDAAHAALLTEMLEGHGFRVALAPGGAEALKNISAREPRVVLSSVSLPDIDGYELCRRIKNKKELKNIPVLLFAGLSDPGDILKSLDCGADNFFLRPIDRKDLVTRIEFILSNLRLHGVNSPPHSGVEIFFEDKKYVITSERQQILNLLISVYRMAVEKNRDLITAQAKLRLVNERLEEMVRERTAELMEEIRMRNVLGRRLRESHEALKGANRALKILRACDKARVNATDEVRFLHNICRIIVDGGYRLAWVGYPEEGGTVLPVAQAGYEDGSLDAMRLTWAEDDPGSIPGGAVFRTGEPLRARDIRENPSYSGWSEEARRRGYSSSLALPLKKEGKVFGVLSIYASEREAFDDEEASFLQELAEDIAYGINTIRFLPKK